jgi:DNA-binding XRE family transcriptional regulator
VRAATCSCLRPNPMTWTKIADYLFGHKAMSEKIFADRLTELRKAAGLSVADLAKRCGLARDTIYRLERGERHPLLETVQKIALALGLGMDSW